MSEVTVFVPIPDQPTRIARGSALVGRQREGAAVHVYYEGNIYGAENMVTFADRAMFAYWRMRDHYATVAQAVLPQSTILAVGMLLPTLGRIIPSIQGVEALADWLEIPVLELPKQLEVAGVRL